MPRCPTSVPTCPLYLRVSILTRLVRQSLALTAVTVLTLTALSFLVARSLMTQRVFSQLSSLVASREDRLTAMIRVDRERAALLASRPEVREVVIGRRDGAIVNSLFNTLLEEQVPVLGMTVFDTKANVIRSIGVRSQPLSAPPLTTVLIPHIDDRQGWRQHSVYAPVRDPAGNVRGVLVLRYNSVPILLALFSELSLGETEEIFVGRRAQGNLFLIHHSHPEERVHTLSLGSSTDERHAVDFSLLQAVQGEEGVHRTYDFRGHDVFAAYRSIPSLGWGIVVKVDRAEALAGVWRLALFLLAIGILFTVLAGYIGALFARRLTAPLLRLSERVGALKPGHWGFQSSIRTADEVEVLDRVIADLTARLRDTYKSLEDEIAARTGELQKQYALDRAILQSIQHGVLTVDATGHITDVNPAACQMLGYERRELIGKSGVEVLEIRRHEGPLTLPEHPLVVCLKRRAAYRPAPALHLSILCKDHTLLPVLLIAAPLLEGKKLNGAILVFQDMKEERQIDYMKSEFISLASHQLRTPLSTARWYLELLAGDEVKNLTTEERSYVKEILHATYRMVHLLDALLRVARLEGGGLNPQKQCIDMVKSLGEMLEELKILAKEAKVHCQFILPRRKVTVCTDFTLLRIIIQNLFTNALKYANSGRAVEVHLTKKKRHVEIAVQDHGIGIPKSEQKRVFEKFFRAHNVRRLDTTGSGLGLYISQRIAESLGAKISFKSAEGRGSTFTVKIPIDGVEK